MIKEIATDVLNKLNRLTILEDFDGLVGMDGHLTKIESLLCPKSNEVRMIGILGPRGIGKTTIARALYHHISRDFELSCFVENIRGRFSRTHHDDYRYKLELQQEFLSLLLDDKCLRVNHSRVVKERISNHRVFVVLDDVDGIEQLQALADKDNWFGPKSRIVVITENKDLLIRHGINYIYEVNLPSGDEALQIFCQYAFRQNSPSAGFQDLAKEVARLASRLPLGLNVLGSSLYGRSKDEWRKRLPRLQDRLDGKIERELRVGYDCLDEKDQAIFRHIACMFPNNSINYVKSMLYDSDLDIELGLETLARNSLIQISSRGIIEMHNLLQHIGTEIVRQQNINEPGKREFLVDLKDIEHILIDKTGTDRVLGISLDISRLSYELSINEKAFESMTNLQFLSINKSFSFPDKNKVQLPKGLSKLPHKLRLLQWDQYPLKSLPLDFCPKHLVELTMTGTKLEKVWEGTKLLGRLEWMNLSFSKNLKEIPDLSEASSLRTLNFQGCLDLAALPFIGHLSKLTTLKLEFRNNPPQFPRTTIMLESLNEIDCEGCSQLRCFPETSRNLKRLNLCDAVIGEVLLPVRLWSHLTELEFWGCENLKAFPHVPNCIKSLSFIFSGIEEVPSWIEDLFRLRELQMGYCKKLTNISSNIFKLENLQALDFYGCENLESFSPPLESPEIPREKVSATLDLASNEFESPRDQFLFRCEPNTLDLRNCKKLVELPKLPQWVSQLRADGCESLERISHPFNNDSKTKLCFRNCFKLSEEARGFIQETICRYAILPGTKLPPYITHRTSGSSLIIGSDKMPISGFFKSTPYLLLAAILNPGLKSTDAIGFHVKCQHGSVVFQREWSISLQSCGGFFIVDFQSEHLIIFRIFDWPKEDDVPRDELSHEQRVLELTCDTLEDSKVREFGVYQHLDSACVNVKEKSNIDSDGGHHSASDSLPSDIDPHHQWLLLF